MALDDVNIDATIEEEHEEAAAEYENFSVADNDRKRKSCVCLICHVNHSVNAWK